MTERPRWQTLAALEPGLDWERLDVYVGELERWNRARRLVGPREVKGIRAQVEDALLPFLFLPPAFPLLDVGSGAGLPGLAIAIAFGAAVSQEPQPQIVCLEPLGKKVSFLRHAVRHLGLAGVEVVADRAETALESRPEFRGYFQTSTARAVGAAGDLLSLAEPYLAKSGRVFLPRGEEPPLAQNGWQVVVDVRYDGPPGVGPRRLHVYEREIT